MQEMNGKKGWGILLLIGLSFYGCATTGDVQILDRHIHRLHSQLNMIQKEKDSLKNELADFRKEMPRDTQKDVLALKAELKAEIKTETQRLRSDLLLRVENLQSDLLLRLKNLQSDLSLRVENLQTEIKTISTGVEEFKAFLNRPSKEIERVRENLVFQIKLLEEREKTIEEKRRAQEERIKGIEDRIKELDGKVSSLALKLVEVEKSIPPKETPVEVKGIAAGAGDLYKDAYETFQKGELEGARKKFETFLKQYPNIELSDNAQFWIGETYFLKKDFEKAILEYEKVIVKYPEGDKIPSALLKQALAFLELGDKVNARNLFKRVVERYPNSDQAEIAKKKLEGIK